MRLNRPALVRLVRRSALAVAVLAVMTGAGLWLLDRLDRAFPPPLDSAAAISTEVVDRNGVLLRAYALEDGRWRLSADLDRIDRAFVAMLVAYEDQRFWSHRGVDPLALLRAAGQFLANGRIVSGGSTLTMQLARLIEPRAERSLGAKLRQMARALQIERRLSKREILTRYLTLAPYGGNLEGVRAASLAWFGKEPARLSLPQAALLVALPQSPEARRPDRHPDAARAARDRVLARHRASPPMSPTPRCAKSPPRNATSSPSTAACRNGWNGSRKRRRRGSARKSRWRSCSPGPTPAPFSPRRAPPIISTLPAPAGSTWRVSSARPARR